MTDEIDPQGFDGTSFTWPPCSWGRTKRSIPAPGARTDQLQVIAELEAIPLDHLSIPQTSHGIPYTAEIRTGTREDTWVPCENTGEILAQAPSVDQGCFVVPEIPHTELGPVAWNCAT